jgi:hypothetical protein
VYRSYRGDVSLLTDIVRCAVQFETPQDLLEFVENWLFVFGEPQCPENTSVLESFSKKIKEFWEVVEYFVQLNRNSSSDKSPASSKPLDKPHVFRGKASSVSDHHNFKSKVHPVQSSASASDSDMNNSKSKVHPVQSSVSVSDSDMNNSESKVHPVQSSASASDSDMNNSESKVHPVQSSVSVSDSDMNNSESKVHPVQSSASDSDMNNSESKVHPVQSSVSASESDMNNSESKVHPVQSSASASDPKSKVHKIFDILRIRNRFDPDLEDVPGGYRDFALKIKIGFFW